VVRAADGQGRPSPACRSINSSGANMTEVPRAAIHSGPTRRRDSRCSSVRLSSRRTGASAPAGVFSPGARALGRSSSLARRYHGGARDAFFLSGPRASGTLAGVMAHDRSASRGRGGSALGRRQATWARWSGGGRRSPRGSLSSPASARFGSDYLAEGTSDELAIALGKITRCEDRDASGPSHYRSRDT